MNYRTATLLAGTDVTTAGTRTIDINVKEPISRISIYWQVTASKHGMDSYCHRDMVKIELVDGSDVLHSLNGGQNQALCIYDRKVPTMIHGQFAQGDSLRSMYGIDFGRFLYDPVLALDPTRFRNLQLKITHNESLADTGAGANELEVLADVFDEKVVSPMGFLMAKEHFSYNPGSTGYEYIDLPTDHPLRKLLVQGYLSAFEPWHTVAEARLDEDNEKRVPFDWDIERYYTMMKGIWTPVVDNIVGQVGPNSNKDYYGTPTDYWAMPIVVARSVDNEIWGLATSRGGKITIYNNDAGNGGFFGRYCGWLPNHCVEFPFGDPKDIDDWYDITKLGSLRLRLKGGSGYAAGGTGAVVLQQLRRY